MTSKRGEFPVSIGTAIMMLVAVMIIGNTVAELAFHAQSEPLVVDTVEQAIALESNQHVQIDLPLDAQQAQSFDFGFSDDVHVLAPFQGTDLRLIYVVLAAPEVPENELLQPPFRGRTVARDFDDSWNLGPARDAKLDSLFEGGLPNDALVVRPASENAVSFWQWFVTVLASLFLLWVIFLVIIWVLGYDLSSGQESHVEHGLI